MKKRVLIVLISLVVAFILIWAINRIVKIGYLNSENIVSEENKAQIPRATITTSKDIKSEFAMSTLTEEETSYLEKVLQNVDFKETDTIEEEQFIINTSNREYGMNVINNEVYVFTVDDGIKKEARLNEGESNKIIEILKEDPINSFI